MRVRKDEHAVVAVDDAPFAAHVARNPRVRLGMDIADGDGIAGFEFGSDIFIDPERPALPLLFEDFLRIRRCFAIAAGRFPIIVLIGLHNSMDRPYCAGAN